MSNATYFKTGNPENPETPKKFGDIERLTNAWKGSDDSGRNRAKKVFENTEMLSSNDDATPNIEPALQVFDEVVPDRRVFLRGELEGIKSAKLDGNTIVQSGDVPLDETSVICFKQHVRLRMVEVALISNADVDAMLPFMPPDVSETPPTKQGDDDHGPTVYKFTEVEDLLTAINFKLAPVDGDGNCFFRAIAEAFGDQNNHAQFRREAVNAFSSLDPVFVAQIDRAWTNNMSRDGVWADQYAVKSMANALDVCIVVYKQILDVGGKTLHFAHSVYEPDPPKCAPENTIVLLNTGGDLHFDLLTPLGTI